MSKRGFDCPYCSGRVRFDWIWILGVEKLLRCPDCGRRFKTGYKAGALLFALALVLALATANLGVWLLSSRSLPVFVILIVPLWIYYGFVMRRWWLVRRCRRQYRKSLRRTPEN